MCACTLILFILTDGVLTPAVYVDCTVVLLLQVARLYDAWVATMPRVMPFYAVKCNPEPSMVALLAALGAGFDCASIQVRLVACMQHFTALPLQFLECAWLLRQHMCAPCPPVTPYALNLRVCGLTGGQGACMCCPCASHCSLLFARVWFDGSTCALLALPSHQTLST